MWTLPNSFFSNWCIYQIVLNSSKFDIFIFIDEHYNKINFKIVEHKLAIQRTHTSMNNFITEEGNEIP